MLSACCKWYSKYFYSLLHCPHPIICDSKLTYLSNFMFTFYSCLTAVTPVKYKYDSYDEVDVLSLLSNWTSCWKNMDFLLWDAMISIWCHSNQLARKVNQSLSGIYLAFAACRVLNTIRLVTLMNGSLLGIRRLLLAIHQVTSDFLTTMLLGFVLIIPFVLVQLNFLRTKKIDIFQMIHWMFWLDWSLIYVMLTFRTIISITRSWRCMYKANVVSLVNILGLR